MFTCENSLIFHKGIDSYKIQIQIQNKFKYHKNK